MSVEKLICPFCHHGDAFILNHHHRRLGTALGGGIGIIASCFGRSGGIAAGAVVGGTLGSLLPGLGTATGMVVGGLSGALTGFFTGAAIGNGIGHYIDKQVVAQYRCGHCGGIFQK
ncbi:MAG: hypothetical protein PHQ27_08120 [Victivallales bacterium]|nr:hypothetical protein [Victivallales bacterium]